MEKGHYYKKKFEAVNPHWILCQMHFISEKNKEIEDFPIQ